MIYLIEDSSETIDFDVWYILTAKLSENGTKPNFLTDIQQPIGELERFCRFKTLNEHNTDIERVFWYECRHRIKVPLPEVADLPTLDDFDLYSMLLETWKTVLEPLDFKDINISDYLSKEVDNGQ